MLFNFQKPVTKLLPMMPQWHFKKQQFIFCINYHQITVILPQGYNKPKTIDELKEALHIIWDNQPQEPINKAVKNLSKQLKACVGASFEHSQWQWNSGTWSDH